MTEFKDNIKNFIFIESLTENLFILEDIINNIKIDKSKNFIKDYFDVLNEILTNEDNVKIKFISLWYLKEFIKVSDGNEINIFLESNWFKSIYKIGTSGSDNDDYKQRGKKCIAIKNKKNIINKILIMIYELIHEIFFNIYNTKNIKNKLSENYSIIKNKFPKSFKNNYYNIFNIKNNYDSTLTVDKFLFKNIPVEIKKEVKKEVKTVDISSINDNMLKFNQLYDGILYDTIVNNKDYEEYADDIINELNIYFKFIKNINLPDLNDINLKLRVNKLFNKGNTFFENFNKFKNKTLKYKDFQKIIIDFKKSENINNKLKENVIDEESNEDEESEIIKENKSISKESIISKKSSLNLEKNENNFFENNYEEKIENLNESDDFNYNFDNIENDKISSDLKESSLEKENEAIKNNIKKIKSRVSIKDISNSLNIEESLNSINTTDYEFNFENIQNFEKKNIINNNIAIDTIIEEEEEDNLDNSDIEKIINVSKLENFKNLDDVKNVETIEIYEKLKNLEILNKDLYEKLNGKNSEIELLKVENDYMRKENAQLNQNLMECANEETNSLNNSIISNKNKNITKENIDLKSKIENFKSDFSNNIDEIQYNNLLFENKNLINKVENLNSIIEEKNTSFNILNEKFNTTYKELKEVKNLFNNMVDSYKNSIKKEQSTFINQNNHNNTIPIKNSTYNSSYINEINNENYSNKFLKPYNLIDNFYKEISQNNNIYYFKLSSIFEKSILFKNNLIEIKLFINKEFDNSSVYLKVNLLFSILGDDSFFVNISNTHNSFKNNINNKLINDNESINLDFEMNINHLSSILNEDYNFPKLILNSELKKEIILFLPITINKMINYEVIDKIENFNENSLYKFNIEHNKILIKNINDLKDLFNNSIIVNNNVVVSKFSFFNLEFYYLYINFYEEYLEIQIYSFNDNFRYKDLIYEYKRWLSWILVN